MPVSPVSPVSSVSSVSPAMSPAPAMLALLATEAPARRRAIEQLTAANLADAAIAYALRRLLASDADVAVRALAAGALGSVRLASPSAIPWLVAALADISPVVRDSAIRALARHSAAAAYAPLCALARTDTTWWVRRAALYALGVIGTHTSADPIVPARAALTDPFWRVRHAAVQVLTIYGNRAPDRRPEILADVTGGTAEYLRALWGPTLVGDTVREPIPSRLPPALLDRDPAVVTARLADLDAPPLSIVELLCDPHVPLRTLAAARLIEANDADAFAASLHWLDEPRIPHVAATVTTMLDSLGDAARDLATSVLSSPARPGASRWAIGWVVATRYLDLAALAWDRAIALDERTLAMPLAPVGGLVDALCSTDEPLAIAAADELLLRPSRVRHEVLAAIEPHASSAVRMRLAAVAGPERDADVERAPVSAHVGAALADSDPLARATALSAIGARVSAETRRAALADIDPAVRESVVAHATLDELAALLDTERDPWVRRAASRAIVRAIRDARRPDRIDRVAGAVRHDLLLRISSDADEWIRTLAISLLDPSRADHLARIVALAADPSVMVQSAIVEVLATVSDERLLAAVTAAVDNTAVHHAIGAWLDSADEQPANQTSPSGSRPYDVLTTVRTSMLADASTLIDASVGERNSDAAIDLPIDLPIDVPIDAPVGQRTSDVHDVLTAASTSYGRNRDEGPLVAKGGVSKRGVASSDLAAGDTVRASDIPRRALGASGAVTTPLIVSGAFDLQPGSLRVAAERGVTTYFWEPAYAGLSRFLRSKSERARSQVVTGTYHADEASIVKDVDRALRRLRREVIDVYLLFWTRSDARVDERAFEVMSALQRAGKVRAIGFSTHDRALATRALDRSPWDVVMTRHSAAHAGIEDGFLAHARAKGAGVITFTALCYGRMVKGDGAPSAQDCYRYSLAQEGVTATISAPRRHRELVENLEVLRAGAMTAEEIERVRVHGARVRVESQKFNALIRQPTRDAAAAAMAMLEDALAPGEGDREEACVTPEALQRSLGSRGRGRASLPSAMLRRGRL